MGPGRKQGGLPDGETPHHYVLAHVALRQCAFEDPYPFFAVMASPERGEFLSGLWTQVCRMCDKDGPAGFSIEDVAVHPTRIGEFPVVLVVMPPPKFMTQAYMVCIVLKVPFAELEQPPEDPGLRYFTLEKGILFETEGVRTVFCAWTKDKHLNFGDGPEATPAAFLARVEDALQRE